MGFVFSEVSCYLVSAFEELFYGSVTKNPKQIIPNLESCITCSQAHSGRVHLVLRLKGITIIII